MLHYMWKQSLLTLRSGPKVVPREIYEKSPEKILLSCSALLCFVAIFTFTILLLWLSLDRWYNNFHAGYKGETIDK